MYNITMGRISSTIVAMQKQKCYKLYVVIALVILHAMRMRHVVDCGLPGSTIVFHIIS